jgi:hypothetical protein
VNPQEQQPVQQPPQEPLQPQASPQEPQPQWQYSPAVAPSAVNYQSTAPSGDPSPNPQPANDSSGLAWSAAEFVEHDRSAGWYSALFLLTAAVAGLVYLITKDYVAIGTIVILGMIVAIVAKRKPRQIECEVSAGGIRVDQRTYGFGQFKSFGIIRESLIPSLEFFPVKKFMPSVGMHFNPQDEQKIIQIIGSHLPYEERKMASIDKLSHSLRF